MKLGKWGVETSKPRELTPPYIFCPKCGDKIELVKDKDPSITSIIKQHGYVESARGICRCGVVAVLCIQPLPHSPTFSLFFDIYTNIEKIAETYYTKQKNL